MNFKKIKTQRFILRKFNLNLINRNYLGWFKDPHVRKFILFKPKNLKSLKNDVLKILSENNTILLSISSKKKHIGNLKIHNIDHKKQEAWLGILIGDRKYRNKGATPEILESIKDYKIPFGDSVLSWAPDKHLGANDAFLFVVQDGKFIQVNDVMYTY